MFLKRSHCRPATKSSKYWNDTRHHLATSCKSKYVHLLERMISFGHASPTSNQRSGMKWYFLIFPCLRELRLPESGPQLHFILATWGVKQYRSIVARFGLVVRDSFRVYSSGCRR